MRSAREISFRLRQEAANLYLLWRQPVLHDCAPPENLNLPDPSRIAEALKGTEYANRVVALAERVVAHQFPVLGTEISVGADVRWRRDYVHAKASGVAYFKRIPYLDFQQVGDHKFVWEINRHQHLVLLAQAYLLTGRAEYISEISAQINSWIEQNPFQQSINWASALEVAFRALSWIWVYHFVGHELDPELRKDLLSGLYQHGLHLAENLSVYFSPNTHLLGEAVALFVLATLFPEFPNSSRWAEVSRRIVLEQASVQVKKDGSHFEQSSYYHVYAVDFFLLFYLVAGKPPELKTTLQAMAEYLNWLLGPSREIDFFGDDDGGRLFHPYGSRSSFGRATLATCGVLFGRSEWVGTAEELAEQAVWWTGLDCLAQANPKPTGVIGSCVFQDSGSVFVSAGEFRMQMDCGPFGFGGAGHSHSDTLSVTLRRGPDPVLVDPGTYTYISDLKERNWFRGSGAHNTVRIDGLDQAESVNPFRWAGKPKVKLLRFEQTSQGWLIDARCEYRSFQHRRRVLLNDSGLLVLDTVTGPEGEHACDQIWQLGRGANSVSLTTSAPDSTMKSAFSPAYGRKVEGVCQIASLRGRLPATMAMRLTKDQQLRVSVEDAEKVFQGL